MPNEPYDKYPGLNGCKEMFDWRLLHTIQRKKKEVAEYQQGIRS